MSGAGQNRSKAFGGYATVTTTFLIKEEKACVTSYGTDLNVSDIF
jgi:hypothetical protein